MSGENYHEPLELLPQSTVELHRALWSLIEELQAVDWYQQRADATKDEALRAVLLHNRNEEIEHAMMNLEWIRRNEPVFARIAQTYLFTSQPITEIEEEEGTGENEGNGSGGGEAKRAGSDGSLGIGSLRAK